eukprot:3683879-Pyramimonas_sp.AAC.2
MDCAGPATERPPEPSRKTFRTSSPKSPFFQFGRLTEEVAKELQRATTARNGPRCAARGDARN